MSLIRQPSVSTSFVASGCAASANTDVDRWPGDSSDAVPDLENDEVNSLNWLHEAALLLGADVVTAQAFSETGQIQFNDVLLRLQQCSDGADDWFAVALAPRPHEVDPVRWRHALLNANGSLMLAGPWCIGMDEEEHALVAMLLPPHAGDSALLCGTLFGLLCVAEGLMHGVLEPLRLSAKEPRGATGVPEDVNADIEVASAIASVESQAAFSPAMEALLQSAVAALGGGAADRERTLRDSTVTVGSQTIALAFDSQSGDLIASVEIDAWEFPDRILNGNLALFMQTGMAFGRLSERLVLQGRWDVGNGDKGADLAHGTDGSRSDDSARGRSIDPDDNLIERSVLLAAWLIDMAEQSLAIAATANRRHAPLRSAV